MRKNQNNTGPTGIYVEVKNGDFQKAYRKFKKKLADDGILQDLRKKEYFVSKGKRRRLEKQAAIRRYKKNREKDQDI